MYHCTDCNTFHSEEDLEWTLVAPETRYEPAAYDDPRMPCCGDTPVIEAEPCIECESAPTAGDSEYCEAHKHLEDE